MEVETERGWEEGGEEAEMGWGAMEQWRQEEAMV